jgi:hypothetical protein
MDLMSDQPETIFVTIAACNEYLIEHTIKSAIALSDNPQRVFFGVFNNILTKEKSLLENDFICNNPRIFYAEIITPTPMGTGFGRMNASLLTTKDHDFVLQIDSHTIFTKGWDSKLIENFKKVVEIAQTDKIILSAIPRGNLYYDINNRDVLLSNDGPFEHMEDKRVNLYENEYHKIIDYKLTKPELRYDGWQGKFFEPLNVGTPITYGAISFGEEDYPEINCIHASLVFFKHSVVKDIIHDPFDEFNGDQINHTLRILSRGYRIFSMKEPLLLSLNKVEADIQVNGGPSVYLDPEWNWKSPYVRIESGREYANHLEQKALEHRKKIFNGDYLGYWGAPDKESLDRAKQIMNFKELEDNE